MPPFSIPAAFWRIGAALLLLLTACAPTAAFTPAAAVAVETPRTPAPAATLSPPASPTAPQATPPDPSATPAACPPARVEPGELDSGAKEPLVFQVYLPPCYQADGARRYPVLYLLHGQGYAEDQWMRLGAPESVTRLVEAGEIEPFILVLPREDGWKQPNETRFEDLLVKQLIPYVDANYPTAAGRAGRGIGGLSRGAAWAVHLGLSHPELFGLLGAHSLPLFWTDAQPLPGWLKALTPETMPLIYLDIGKNDRDLPSALGFEQQLAAYGVPHEWRLNPGYHNEVYWGAHVEEYMRWYGQAFAGLPQSAP